MTAALLKDAQAALENKDSSFHKYQLAVGKVDIFIEFIKPPPHLIIFSESLLHRFCN
ncbi:hypothetical protein [Moorena sp. SIO4G3]|uniref:hypothetical protein n=1 Tax=Moorena sp. SIO4G3 TaxID=2607821 RepID=UPI0025E01BA5|nr:hypothetical protein [Moorena sp. SIO4G3]